MTDPSPMERLAWQMRQRDGRVPETLANPLFAHPYSSISRDAFLLRLPSGLLFHYERNEGVVIEKPDGMSETEVSLYLHGSVFGAVAWLNGFVPLHASAIVHDGRVYAFTGDSGAGKSTLVAGLSQRGYPLQTDDVLVLDPSSDDAVICLPGRSEIKLWKDALELTSASAGSQVRPDMEKFFTSPHRLNEAGPLPLARLYYLETGSADVPSIEPVKGAEAISRLPSVLFRNQYYGPLYDSKRHFALLSRLALAVPQFAFRRYFDRERFDAGLDAIEAHISADS